MGLALLSSILYIFSFPVTSHDWSLWPLAFVSLVPLVLSLERAETVPGQFFRGAAWGAVTAAGLGYWLFYAMVWEYQARVWIALLVMLLGVVAPLAVIYGLFGIFFSLIRDRRMAACLILFPSLWVLAEYIREAVPLLVPWGLLGYAAGPWNAYIQMADITGVYGLSFMAALCNGCVAFIYGGLRPGDGRDPFRGVLRGMVAAGAHRIALAVLAAAILLPPLYGAARRHSLGARTAGEISAGRGIPVTVVQPNFTQEDRWRSGGLVDRINICIGLAGRCATETGGISGQESGAAGERRVLVVWPETVLNSPALIDRRLFNYLRERLPRAGLLVAGGVRRGAMKYGVHNSAYLISGSGATAFYDKNILLPYAERAPFGATLGEYYNAPTEFLPGETPPAVAGHIVTAGLSICFEALYPSHSRRAVGGGAGVLINISNDGWFGKTSELLLHLRQAAFRAVENRRFMIRASNNGFSAVISPSGEIIRQTGLFVPGCLAAEIVPLAERTWYSILGDWVVYLSAGGVALFLGLIIIRK